MTPKIRNSVLPLNAAVDVQSCRGWLLEVCCFARRQVQLHYSDVKAGKQNKAQLSYCTEHAAQTAGSDALATLAGHRTYSSQDKYDRPALLMPGLTLGVCLVDVFLLVATISECRLYSECPEKEQKLCGDLWKWQVGYFNIKIPKPSTKCTSQKITRTSIVLNPNKIYT